jgi:hypothetical protein
LTDSKEKAWTQTKRYSSIAEKILYSLGGKAKRTVVNIGVDELLWYYKKNENVPLPVEEYSVDKTYWIITAFVKKYNNTVVTATDDKEQISALTKEIIEMGGKNKFVINEVTPLGVYATSENGEQVKVPYDTSDNHIFAAEYVKVGYLQV